VANDELSINKYNSFQDQLSSQSERQLLENVYKLIGGKFGNYQLKSDISKEEYKRLYQMQKEHDLLVENIIRGQKMPDDVLTNDNFPIIYEIGNLDHHFIGQKGQTSEEMREFLHKARENNLMFMFLTPLIPILGFLWLFFSVKHTYERQQEEEKKRKSTKQA
jgi:hypothetical protein